MKRVLVADDDAAILQLVEAMTVDQFEVLSARSCREAISLLSSRGPDLALLDYDIRDGTGLDVLAAMSRAGRRVPVVIMSGSGDVQEAALRSGAAFLPKPFSCSELLSALEGAIRRSEAGTGSPNG